MKDLAERIKEKNFFVLEEIPPFPQKNFLIEVTNFCNHKCIFCANSKMTRPRGFIKQEIAFRVLEEAYKEGMREVGFYATGEPLLNKDLAFYVKYAKKIGYDYVYLTTNGALATKERIDELMEFGLDSIKFSINAGTRKTYIKMHGKDDFDIVLKNIKVLSKNLNKRRKVKIFVSCILNKINILEREILLGELKGYVDEIYFCPVGNQGGMMYEINKSLKLDGEEDKSFKKKCPCSLPFNSITVTFEGYLTACCIDFQNYLVVADLNIMSLKEAWVCDQFRKLRKAHIERRVEKTLCYNCIYNTITEIHPVIEKYATYYDPFNFSKIETQNKIPK